MTARRIDANRTITRRQQSFANQPLAYCPQFPQIAERFESWWQQKSLNYPIYIALANRNPARPITRRLDLLHHPEAWFNAKLTDLQQTYCVGDALPAIRIDFGPAAMGGLIGGEVEFHTDTAWTHATINDDWSNAPEWSLQLTGQWWQWLIERAKTVAQHAAGRYLVCAADLGGGADVMANMRGPQNLCMDTLEQPEKIRDALTAIYPAWRSALEELYDIVTEHGTGLIQWVKLWSHTPYTTITCDFNALVGSDEFQELFVPDITRQALSTDRAVFHLDGPDASRHIDALLDIEPLDAIQFTPGTGSPSAMRWVPMFCKILDRGKSVLMACPNDEIIPLWRVLGSRGVAFMTDDSIENIDYVWQRLQQEATTS